MADQTIIKNLKKKEQQLLKEFGLIVRNKRQEKGWTLEDTEANGYSSWQHWQAIESGLKNISFTTVINICRTLKIQPHQLFSELNLN